MSDVSRSDSPLSFDSLAIGNSAFYPPFPTRSLPFDDVAETSPPMATLEPDELPEVHLNGLEESPPASGAVSTNNDDIPEADIASSRTTDADEASEPVPGNYDLDIIDPRGDLWVLVYGPGSWGSSTPLRFKVCSRTLARTSPVFEKMLYGPFAEATKQGLVGGERDDWEISLPEMPPLGMKQLFEIMHCRFVELETVSEVVEQAITSDNIDHETDRQSAVDEMKAANQQPCTAIRQLYDLVIAADYFDCVAILRPWTAEWMRQLTPVQSDEGEIMREAWIYYHLGHQNRYEHVVTQLAIDFPVPTPAADDASSTQPLSMLPSKLPVFCLEAIAALRQRAIGALLDTVSHTADILLDNRDVPLGLCVEPEPNHYSWDDDGIARWNDVKLACESQLLGRLQRELRWRGLWPLPNTETIGLSARKFYDILKEFRTKRDTSWYESTHRECVLVLRPEGGFLSYQYNANDEEVRYMDKQRSLTGV